MVTRQPDLNYYEKREEVLPLGLYLSQKVFSCVGFQSVFPTFLLIHTFYAPIKRGIFDQLGPMHQLNVGYSTPWVLWTQNGYGFLCLHN